MPLNKVFRKHLLTFHAFYLVGNLEKKTLIMYSVHKPSSAENGRKLKFENNNFNHAVWNMDYGYLINILNFYLLIFSP